MGAGVTTKEFSMRNFSKLLGIIALAAVIGFSFAACGDGGGGGSGGGGGGGGGKGTFTLTDIPSQYNGKYIAFDYSDGQYPISGYESRDKGSGVMTITACKISNGRASMPTWWLNNKRYDGNQKVTASTYHIYLRFYIMDTQKFTFFEAYDSSIKLYMEHIQFTNGSATKSWNDGEVQ
jgi:hypothetical protein